MNIESPEERRLVLDGMKSIADSSLPAYESRLLSRLTPYEQEIYRAVRQRAFEEGSWYRPIHNVVVPSAMLAICYAEGLDRKTLMP